MYATKDCVPFSTFFGKKYLFDISDSLSNLKLDFKLYYKESELL